MIWLALGFFITAVLYASVGFGGGSTYSALLSLAGFDYRLLPLLSLACNVVVVTGSTIRFARSGTMPWRGALVLSLVAAPFAFLGGLTPVKQTTFLFLLGLSLVLAGLALLLPRRTESEQAPARLAKTMPFVAAPVGYLAGLVGIGGGIFFAPLLHLTRWDGVRRIAATTSLFILINSLAGIAGQLAKRGASAFGEAITYVLPLLIAVVIGGQIGSLLAQRLLPERVIRWLTAALTIWAGSRLLRG